VKLTVIGCSGSFPGPESPASCYLLEAPYDDGTGERTWRVLLDLGNGALGRLQQVVDPLTVDAVLLSHLHADHCLDLCGYYVMRKYHPDGPRPRLPVWGPSDTANRMARAYDLPVDPGMRHEFDFRAYDGKPLRVGPFTVDAIPVEHPVEAYGLRVTCGSTTLAYTGDTAPCEALERLAAGVDLLLAEASFRDGDQNPPEIHLTGADCGRLAAAAEASRLVLTHIPPWFDKAEMLAEAKAEWDGKAELAVAGTSYEL
jgi:ribonuclease BN (tRNA processing enzyme)